MASRQELADRFRHVVAHPPPNAEKLQRDQFRSTVNRVNIPNGRMDLIIFAPQNDESEQLLLPTAGIEVFTQASRNDIKEHTFFNLRPDDEIVRSHTVWMLHRTVPIKSILSIPQSEALLEYAKNPRENKDQLVIARELNPELQAKLDERLKQEAEQNTKFETEWREMARQQAAVWVYKTPKETEDLDEKK